MMNDAFKPVIHGFTIENLLEIIGNQALRIRRLEIDIDLMQEIMNSMIKENNELRKTKENG